MKKSSVLLFYIMIRILISNDMTGYELAKIIFKK